MGVMEQEVIDTQRKDLTHLQFGSKNTHVTSRSYESKLQKKTFMVSTDIQDLDLEIILPTLMTKNIQTKTNGDDCSKQQCIQTDLRVCFFCNIYSHQRKVVSNWCIVIRREVPFYYRICASSNNRILLHVN